MAGARKTDFGGNALKYDVVLGTARPAAGFRLEKPGADKIHRQAKKIPVVALQPCQAAYSHIGQAAVGYKKIAGRCLILSPGWNTFYELAAPSGEPAAI